MLSQKQSNAHNFTPDILRYKDHSTIAISPASHVSDGVNSSYYIRNFVLSKKEQAVQLPERYRGILKGKRNVSLRIENNIVIFEFKGIQRFVFELVVEAVKTITGRQYDSNCKHWTCPLTSLLEAIRLYEYMGRVVEPALKSRAAQYTSCGLSASNAVLAVHIPKFSEDVNDYSRHMYADQSYGSGKEDFQHNWSMGFIRVTFEYDTDLIAAIKGLHPNLRDYGDNPPHWKIHLLMMPSLLNCMAQLGYSNHSVVPPDTSSNSKNTVNPFTIAKVAKRRRDELTEAAGGAVMSADLRRLSGACRDLLELLEGNSSSLTTPPADVTAHECGIRRDTSASGSAELGDNLIETSEQKLHQMVYTINYIVRKHPQGRTISVAEEAIAAASQYGHCIDTSNVGSSSAERVAKRHRADYLRCSGLDSHFNEENSCEDEFDQYNYADMSNFVSPMMSSFRTIYRERNAKRNTQPPPWCDCGRHWEEVAGSGHICRYFGTFECKCGNIWTSGRTFKDYRQECRDCGDECLPKDTKPLQNKSGLLGRGEHDYARCEMCRIYGDCSLV